MKLIKRPTKNSNLNQNMIKNNNNKIFTAKLLQLKKIMSTKKTRIKNFLTMKN